jgi:hypothetical protein
VLPGSVLGSKNTFPERGMPALYESLDRVSAVELSVAHVVAATLQLGNNPAAAPAYREHPVARAVGDEEAPSEKPPIARRAGSTA